MTNKIRLLETELNTLKTAKAASDQLAYNVVKQAEQQGVEVGGEETQMTETVSKKTPLFMLQVILLVDCLSICRNNTDLCCR